MSDRGKYLDYCELLAATLKAIRRDSRFLREDLLGQLCDGKCGKQRKSVKLPKYYSAVSLSVAAWRVYDVYV